MPPQPVTPPPMPFRKYVAHVPVRLPDRTWPDRELTRAPIWCPVDLRDGNQALVNPMNPHQKLMMFQTLVGMGYKEIEVGFPSASQTDYDFLRLLIEEDHIPEDVTVQVLVQCREDLIRRTYEALRGAPAAIVHFYNSTSTVQRRVVFGLDEDGVVDIATAGAKLCKELAAEYPETNIRFEYSPESYTGTEVDFAVRICNAVADVIQPTPERPLILNLPATVEMYTANIYADTIEYFLRNINKRDSIILSVHTHNDRGTAVAAAEFAMLAGADRVEGCLFGNGERTGNVDIVTMGCNLFSQGIDPMVDFSNIDEIRRTAEHCTGIAVHVRHPYAGAHVFTAFSGSHQDAIRKGLSAIRPDGAHDYEIWEVPYLPVDPAHLGRQYAPIIRVNSQSGKAGAAYIIETSFGFRLPRGLQVAFADVVQARAEQTGTEVSPEAIGDLFVGTYMNPTTSSAVDHIDLRSQGAGEYHVSATVTIDGTCTTVAGSGDGPIAAFIDAVNRRGLNVHVSEYYEHTVGTGANEQTVSYAEVVIPTGERAWGVGIRTSAPDAGFDAVIRGAAGIHRMMTRARSIEAPGQLPR